MSDEQKDRRISVEDLPQAEAELSAEEAKEVKGGLTKTGAGTLNLNSTNTSNTGNNTVQGNRIGTD
jgi:hypothetical protein